MKKWLCLLPLATLVALVYSVVNPKWAESAFLYSGYYFICALVMLFCVTLYSYARSINFSARDCLRFDYPGIVIAGVATVILFGSVRCYFKTLSDETNLLAVSQSMYFDHTVYLRTQAKYYYDNLYLLSGLVPMRPLLFPFLTSVLHTFFGYHAANAFVLNGLLSFIFLTFVAVIVRRVSDTYSAIAAVLLVVSQPVYSLCATSAGFDLLAATLFFAVLGGLFLYLKNLDGRSFGLLWILLVAFAHTRYESSAFVFFILLGLFVCRRLRWSIIKETAPIVALTAPLILPLVWQKLVAPSDFGNEPGTAVFGLEYVVKNGKELVSGLFDFNRKLPYATPLALISAVLLAWTLLKRDSNTLNPWPKYFRPIACATFSFQLIFYLSYYFGRYAHPSSARMFLIFSITTALFPIVVHVCEPGNTKRSLPILASALLLFLVYHPIAADGRFINQLTLIRESEFTLDVLRKFGDKRVLVITDRPGQVMTVGYGSVGFSYANGGVGELKTNFDRHLFSKILVFQRISCTTHEPLRSDSLDPRYQLSSPIAELQTDADAFVRASQVVGVNDALGHGSP